MRNNGYWRKRSRSKEKRDERIVRMEEKINLLIRDQERIRHQHQMDMEKMEDIKQFVMNSRKNETFEVFEALSP
jgi:hypothetical protein